MSDFIYNGALLALDDIKFEDDKTLVKIDGEWIEADLNKLEEVAEQPVGENFPRSKTYYQKHKDEILKKRRDTYLSKSVDSRSYSREYYKTHKDKIKAYQKKYKETHKAEMNKKRNLNRFLNKDKINEKRRNYFRIYRAKNKEKLAEYNKKYYETHGKTLTITYQDSLAERARRVSARAIALETKEKIQRSLAKIASRCPKCNAILTLDEEGKYYCSDCGWRKNDDIINEEEK